MRHLKKIFLVLLICGGALYAVFHFIPKKRNTIYLARDYLHFANHFRKNGDVAKEIVNLKKVVAIQPDNFSATKRLAVLHYELDDYEAAISYFKKAYELNNSAKDCLYYIGYLSFYKKYDAHSAIEAMQEYIAFDKNNVTAHIVLHDNYMRTHQFEKALMQNDEMEKVLIATGVVKKNKTLWDGSDVRGKTIVLRDNVGIGDLFCWLRYVKNLKENGATVILEVRPYLIPILSKCTYIDRLIARGKPLPHFDFQVPLGAIPHYFVKHVDGLKADMPYMHADDVLTARWKAKLSKDTNFKVGICWDPCVYKNKDGTDRKNKRAIPLCYFAPLSRLENVSLYSLQRINGIDQIKSAGFSLYTFNEKFDKTHGSFSDTAAVMKNLDLVVTADTSVAHLAGALGVPVWVILPFVPDWRWTIEETTTPLYPTMRLFKQKKLGDWEQVVSEVCLEFSKLVKGRK